MLSKYSSLRDITPSPPDRSRVGASVPPCTEYEYVVHGKIQWTRKNDDSLKKGWGKIRYIMRLARQATVSCDLQARLHAARVQNAQHAGDASKQTSAGSVSGRRCSSSGPQHAQAGLDASACLCRPAKKRLTGRKHQKRALL